MGFHLLYGLHWNACIYCLDIVVELLQDISRYHVYHPLCFTRAARLEHLCSSLNIFEPFKLGSPNSAKRKAANRPSQTLTQTPSCYFDQTLQQTLNLRLYKPMTMTHLISSIESGLSQTLPLLSQTPVFRLWKISCGGAKLSGIEQMPHRPSTKVSGD